MNCNIIEKFNEDIEFCSSYLNCTQEILNTLVVRIKINKRNVEYRFYDVLEYQQLLTEESKQCDFSIIQSDDWIRSFIECNDGVFPDVELQESKHYVFKLMGTQFQILAGGYIKDFQHSNTYCEQSKILELIQ